MPWSADGAAAPAVAWLPPATVPTRPAPTCGLAAHGLVGYDDEKLTETYVPDEQMHEFFLRSNPWAPHGMAGRLLEAADRRLWDAPDPDTLAALRQACLHTEGDLEDR